MPELGSLIEQRYLQVAASWFGAPFSPPGSACWLALDSTRTLWLRRDYKILRVNYNPGFSLGRPGKQGIRTQHPGLAMRYLLAVARGALSEGTAYPVPLPLGEASDPADGVAAGSVEVEWWDRAWRIDGTVDGAEAQAWLSDESEARLMADLCKVSLAEISAFWDRKSGSDIDGDLKMEGNLFFEDASNAQPQLDDLGPSTLHTAGHLFCKDAGRRVDEHWRVTDGYDRALEVNANDGLFKVGSAHRGYSERHQTGRRIATTHPGIAARFLLAEAANAMTRHPAHRQRIPVTEEPDNGISCYETSTSSWIVEGISDGLPFIAEVAGAASAMGLAHIANLPIQELAESLASVDGRPLLELPPAPLVDEDCEFDIDEDLDAHRPHPALLNPLLGTPRGDEALSVLAYGQLAGVAPALLSAVDMAALAAGLWEIAGSGARTIWLDADVVGGSNWRTATYFDEVGRAHGLDTEGLPSPVRLLQADKLAFADPGQGTWLQARLVFRREATPEIRRFVNTQRPDAPRASYLRLTAFDLKDELRLFPRLPARIPMWMRERVGAGTIPHLDSTGEIREAYLDGLGELDSGGWDEPQADPGL